VKVKENRRASVGSKTGALLKTGRHRVRRAVSETTNGMKAFAANMASGVKRQLRRQQRLGKGGRCRRSGRWTAGGGVVRATGRPVTTTLPDQAKHAARRIDNAAAPAQRRQTRRITHLNKSLAQHGGVRQAATRDAADSSSCSAAAPRHSLALVTAWNAAVVAAACHCLLLASRPPPPLRRLRLAPLLCFSSRAA